MTLHTLTEDGHMAWDCVCGVTQTAHISHEGVQHDGAGTVALPACACGSRTFLTVDFTPQELQAFNMLDENMQPTASYHTAQRQMALLRQMQAAGKG